MPRVPNPSFMKPMQPDDVLSLVIGAEPLPRTEATKRIWTYIKAHNLQDATARRMIVADDLLCPLLGGKERISMLELPKFLNQHLKKMP